jgi:hypothetical protein
MQRRKAGRRGAGVLTAEPPGGKMAPDIYVVRIRDINKIVLTRL